MPTANGDSPEAPPKSPPNLRRKQQGNTADNDAKRTELTRLRSQANQLFKAMQNAVKARDPVPLSSHTYREIDGIHLVYRTSWGWRATPINSRHREFQNVAGAAVLEWSIIEEYRPRLLMPGSGAQYLRCLLLEKLHRIVKTSYVTKSKVQFTFVDQVVHQPLTGEESFPIDVMLSQLKEHLSAKSDTMTIQNIVKVFERCPLAWNDLENENDAKFPAVTTEIDRLLRLLAKVCAG